ncbi:MAG: VIT1/CCC1 transporter family protein [Betaproteobacteria bacterium]|nr:VIT1/CCC1 transporter family protein [Betaproteobacteria bacterium]
MNSVDPSEAANLLAAWQSEQQSRYLYERLAAVEKDQAALFWAMGQAAASQAAVWAEKYTALCGKPMPVFTPPLRVRLVAALLRPLGPRLLIPVLAALKVRGVSVYTHSSPRPPAPGHHAPAVGDQPENQHRGLSGGGNLRAAVFGVNDGLLSNASLILGVAGAAADARTILLTGIAGLAAGAFSMAAGEYVSMRSQRELFERQIALERDELAEYPDEEAAELALIYEARGIPQADARRLAQQLISDPEHALDTLAREELGLNPAELGSPWGAALSSFAAFAGGGFIPLLPFILPLPVALPVLWVLMGITALSLFAIGASLSLFTGRNAFYSGARMLFIGGVAGATTYAIGQFFGVAVG